MPDESMNTLPKQTIALIAVLTIITVLLLTIAISSVRNQTSQLAVTPTPLVEQPTPTPNVAKSTLLISPSTISTTIGASSSAQVQIQATQNKVSGVQFEIVYDPTALSNVKITPGTFFAGVNPLISTVDPANGKISYFIILSPGKPAISDSGLIATISFTPVKVGQTSLRFNYPNKTLVSQEGTSQSVLKQALGATIVVQ